MKTFPILFSYSDRFKYPRPDELPRQVPWSLVEPHEAQARANHGQTLERLAQRGGLDPVELYLVLHNLPLQKIWLPEFMSEMTPTFLPDWLKAIVS